MPNSRGNPPDLPSGMNSETDPQIPQENSRNAASGEAVTDYQTETRNENLEPALSWDDLEFKKGGSSSSIAAWSPARAGSLRFLERIALAVERPANRLIGATQLNPFYHTGTIAVLLMIIVGLTGFYLFLFFKYGFDASYNDVLTRIEEPFIARTIRAVHRYASGALVITTLLHAYRILFMERFRGPRWLAWLTGVVMVIFLWIAGVSGYWLIWDQRAQMINDSFINFLQAVTPFAASYVVMLTEADLSGISWPLFLVVFSVHVLMFVITAVFFWLHIKRLSRPKWLPPPYWVVGVSIVVLLVGLIFPAGMLPQGDLERLPGAVTIDPLFLFFLPVSPYPLLGWLLWGGLLLFTIVMAFLPWIHLRRRENMADGQNESQPLPKVNIFKDRCNGCTICALDCPYSAIQMVERDDRKKHKFVAIEDPTLCVSCGICVGSCDVAAITMGDIPPVMLWQEVSSRLALVKSRGDTEQLEVVFTCERHAAQGAKPYLEDTGQSSNGMNIEVITLPCVGTAPPDLLTRALDTGVAGVQVVGCPPDDCTNREGNSWAEQRLIRERVPRLKRSYANAPISAYWLPPDDFSQAVEPAKPSIADNGEQQPIDYLEQRRMFKELNWRNYIVAFILLAAIMVLQVLLTDLPLTPNPDPPAMTQAIVSDLAGSIGRTSYISTILGPELALTLEVNGNPVYNDTIDTARLLRANSTPFYHEYELQPGDHRLRLALDDDSSGTTFVIFDELVQLQEGQIFRYGQ